MLSFLKSGSVCELYLLNVIIVDVLYLDFQKAFDKVPHQRLLLKLRAHGIGNDVINWIEK